MQPRNSTYQSLIIAGCLLATVPVARSQSGQPHEPVFSPAPNISDTLRPLRIDVAPTIDGVFDEPFWKNAPSVSGFKTFIPDFDKEPKAQTEVAMAYDKDNLYFAFRCYDTPSQIKASMSARDKMYKDDFICINLDALNDQQVLTAFYVNPFGIQGDSRSVGGNEDSSPDFVWYSAGKIDSIGYTVEVQLPLKSLRYGSEDPTVMGVVLERYIRRADEHSSFPRLDPAKGFSFLTEMHPLSYPGVDHFTLMELLPAITASRQDVRQGTNLERVKQQGEVSLSGKYGITSDLIFDATVNPDFSQVESDAGQVDVNLRYSLFYPEKRSFFLEGQDNYNLTSTSFQYDPQIFYSRTIADPVLGAKITGKVGPQNSLAVLYALDNVLEADRPVLGRYVHTPIVRYKRSFSDDSYIGMLYTGKELERTNNRVVGYDQYQRLSPSSSLSTSGFLSWATDDPSLPALTGHTFGFNYASGTRDVNYNLAFREVSKDFRADMGYLTRTGLVNIIGYLNPRIFPTSTFFQKFGFEFTTSQVRDEPSGLWETSNDAAMNVFFAGNWFFRTRLNYSTEVFGTQRFQTSGAHVQMYGQPTKMIYFSVTYHRTKAIYYPTAEQGKSGSVVALATVQPSDNLQSDLSL